VRERAQLVVEQPGETACCEACASGRVADEARATPALLQPRRAAFPGPNLRRDADRRIALASIALAGTFLGTALVVVAAGSAPWLPLHLALAGAAGTAIAGTLPFFAAALSAGRPADPRVRAVAVALVAVGGSAVAARGFGAPAWIPTAGGLAFIVGMALVAAMTVGIGRGPAQHRPLVRLAYLGGLAQVLGGASLGTLAVSGNEAVVSAWAGLRPAHAWLNLMGFVSLIVVGTLVHLLPTVAGTRIVSRRSGVVAVVGLIAGPPLVAAGCVLAALGGDGLVAGLAARAGGLLTLVAAVAVGLEGWVVVRMRGRWTTDPGWHGMTLGSLAAAVCWFTVGGVLASARVLVVGASPAAWSTPELAPVIVLGWVAQILIGASAHLLPAIGPGGPGGHAVRRRILGRVAMPRLALLNAGVLLLAVGELTGADSVTLVGGILAFGGLVADLAVAATAFTTSTGPVQAPRDRSAVRA